MNNYQQVLKKVKSLILKQSQQDSTGHGYWHAYRVVQLSLKIAQEEKANLQVVELASWLHDLAVPQGRDQHEILGAKMATDILTNLNCDPSTTKQAADCILSHRYSKKYPLKTIEQKVVQDADNLDALGAIILPRIFAYAGHNQTPIYDPSIKPNPSRYKKTGKSQTAFNHIFEKLIHIPKVLNTKTAKQIAKHRLKYLIGFTEEYLAEFQGKK